TLDRLEVRRIGEEIRLRAEARSFLHNQVRIIVGTLKLVGQGRWSAEDVAEALAARDRRTAGPTAPPHGLYLTRVEYPPAESTGLDADGDALDEEADQEGQRDDAGGSQTAYLEADACHVPLVGEDPEERHQP